MHRLQGAFRRNRRRSREARVAQPRIKKTPALVLGEASLRFLGIDYGLKKIGLAISEGFLVEPFGVFKNKKQLIKICEEQEIKKIIIGISEGKMAEKTRDFGSQLASRTGLPIEYQDETLTSEEAKKLMVKIGKPKKKRQKQEDAVAAALILQTYLDQQKSIA